MMKEVKELEAKYGSDLYTPGHTICTHSIKKTLELDEQWEAQGFGVKQKPQNYK